MPFKEDLLEALPTLKKMAANRLAGGFYGFDVDDLVQETYIRALRGERCYRPNSTLICWLYTVMNNVFLTMVRRRRNKTFVGIPDEFDAASPDGDERFYFSDDIENMLSGMGRRGQILRLQALGYTTKEISDLTGLPRGTIFSAAARARNEFMERWNRNEKRKQKEVSH